MAPYMSDAQATIDRCQAVLSELFGESPHRTPSHPSHEPHSMHARDAVQARIEELDEDVVTLRRALDKEQSRAARARQALE